MNLKKRKDDVLELINFISKSKNLDIEVIIKFLENSITRIIHKYLDPGAEISLKVTDNQLVLTNHNKLVIPDEEEYGTDSKVVDIHLSEAQKIDPNIKIDQTVASQISFDDFSRKIYSQIENSFRIEIVNWERQRIYDKYQPLIGTAVEAKLEENLGERGATFILEDGTMCFMPAKYRNKSINLEEKQYHTLTIEEVYENSKNFQVLVSNDSPNQIREIFKNEIPEIAEGIIQIVAISRIKGERAKIAFRQNPKYPGQVDVIGSIIGPNSSRIGQISRQVGERIDVILYSDNIVEYITNALSPARIISVNKKVVGNGYLVVVPDRHNTLAIGRGGANVKLTVELIRANIDICSHAYALEHNIKLNWNGNIANIEELAQVEAAASTYEAGQARQNRNRQNNKRFYIDLDDFEREVAEYNSEVSAYEPVEFNSFTGFNTPNDETSQALESALNQELHSDDDNQFFASKSDETVAQEKQPVSPTNVNQKAIKAANANFKFDKEIAGDIDFSEYDFSDFDDEF